MNYLELAIAETKAQTAAPVAVPVSRESDGIFTVESAPIHGPYGVIPGKKGLFVDGDNINIVSNKYEIVQPKEVLATFEHVAEKSGLVMNGYRANPKNGGLMIRAKFQDLAIRGEQHEIGLTFYTSHCGTYKTFLTLDASRILCANQVPMLYRNKQRHIFAEKHYQNALSMLTIERAIAHIPESIQAYAEKAEILEQKKLSLGDFLDLWVAQNKLDPKQKQFDSKIAKMRAMYNNGKGQSGLSETAYKAYQAITFANTHDVKDTDMLFENVLTKKSDNSLQWLDLLLENAPVEREMVYLDAE